MPVYDSPLGMARDCDRLQQYSTHKVQMDGIQVLEVLAINICTCIDWY